MVYWSKGTVQIEQKHVSVILTNTGLSRLQITHLGPSWTAQFGGILLQRWSKRHMVTNSIPSGKMVLSDQVTSSSSCASFMVCID